MSAFVLHEASDRDGVFRWGGSAALIVAIHAALIAAFMSWYQQALPPGIALPMVMIDLAPPAPKPSAPEVKPADVPPPEPEAKTEPPPPPPPPVEQAVQEPPAPAEPMVAPAPVPAIEPVPEPATAIPETVKPPPVEAKPVHTETKKPAHAEEKKPAAVPPRERAKPSERPASASAPPSGAPNPNELAAYNRRVAAHLQGFRPAPIAGQQGVSRLSFTLGRNGQVLSSRLAGASGHPALDSEALAMVRRAQPFPPIPPDLKQASISFTVPIAFR
jgi:protein TonB